MLVIYPGEAVQYVGINWSKGVKVICPRIVYKPICWPYTLQRLDYSKMGSLGPKNSKIELCPRIAY